MVNIDTTGSTPCLFSTSFEIDTIYRTIHIFVDVTQTERIQTYMVGAYTASRGKSVNHDQMDSLRRQ